MARMGGAAAVLAFVVVVVMAVGTSSVAGAGCDSGIQGLSPCYSAVVKGGSSPSTQCCATVSKLGLPCICSILTQYANELPSSVDIQSILTLPSKCSVSVPPNYQCAGFNVPS